MRNLEVLLPFAHGEYQEIEIRVLGREEKIKVHFNPKNGEFYILKPVYRGESLKDLHLTGEWAKIKEISSHKVIRSGV